MAVAGDIQDYSVILKKCFHVTSNEWVMDTDYSEPPVCEGLKKRSLLQKNGTITDTSIVINLT